MIRFTVQQPAPNSAIIRLDGRLDSHSLPQLQSLIGPLGPAHALTLDLSGLLSLDPTSRAYLVQLRTAGAKLAGGSLYIAQMLQEA
ncbi:MAG: hypothetical protein GIKADHBN_00900 [Phycisphaerales bacterium]|nr:hypothetical protein [Phycisphaerales bacterium]